MVEHTPGPWMARDCGNDAEWEVVKLDPNKPSRDPWFICTVMDDADNATAEDNARLIAAAPELLASLRELKELFRFALLSTTPDIARDGMGVHPTGRGGHRQSGAPAVIPSDELKLLPCPFCGAEPSVCTYDTESLFSHAIVEYLDINCGACDCAHITGEQQDEVRAAWNTRAPDAGVVTCSAGAGERVSSTEDRSASLERLAGWSTVILTRGPTLTDRLRNVGVSTIITGLTAAFSYVREGYEVDWTATEHAYLDARSRILAPAPSPEQAEER